MTTSNGQLSIQERKKLLEFEELFHTFFPRLKSFAFHIINDENEAEDLVQEVFIQTWKNIDQLNEKSNLGGYLFTSLKNKCLNKIKHDIVKRKFEYHQAYFESEELYHISFLGDQTFIPFQTELSQQIDQLIESMPPKCGEVFRQKWIEGKKHREIAETLNISMTMVDKHLAKGLELARKNLHPEFFILFIYFNNL